MPELPEVETIRRSLVPRLPGRKVEAVTGITARVFLTELETIAARLPGQRFQALERRGKFLIFIFDLDVLVVHLGMTGQVTFWDHRAPDSERFLRHPKTLLQSIRQHSADVHTHLVLRLDGGDALHYRDPRKFGKIRLVSAKDLENVDVLQALGPEPLSEAFDAEPFVAGLRATKRPVKAALLDQRLAAGVGNIYADEALFVARVRPTRRGTTLTRAEALRIHAAVPQVLEKGVRFRGTSFRDYVDSDGTKGTNQELLLAYGRAGEPCRVCGTPIEKIVVAQRGTHFCPKCQPARSGPRNPPPAGRGGAQRRGGR